MREFSWSAAALRRSGLRQEDVERRVRAMIGEPGEEPQQAATDTETFSRSSAVSQSRYDEVERATDDAIRDGLLPGHLREEFIAAGMNDLGKFATAMMGLANVASAETVTFIPGEWSDKLSAPDEAVRLTAGRYNDTHTNYEQREIDRYIDLARSQHPSRATNSAPIEGDAVDEVDRLIREYVRP